MNILLLDQTACMVDFALRCRAEGHYPRVVMGKDQKTKRRTRIGDGLIEKIENEDWQKHMRWADIILVADNNRWLRELDAWRKKGYPVFAPTWESAQFELDRKTGQDVFEKAGLKIMPFEEFSDMRTAAKYVMAEGKRFVSKPSGDQGKELSYVSQGPKDMLFMLDKWGKSNKVKGSFVLQEFVPGTEIAVGGWMGKNGFSKWFYENFEFKKFMNDDKGPNTGEQGTLVRYTDDSQLARECLLPCEGALLQAGHQGFVDVAVIVDEDGNPRPLEFTARNPYPGFNIMQVVHPEPVGWMVELMNGSDTFSPLTDTACGVVVTMPPWPSPPSEGVNQDEYDGIPIYGLDDANPLFQCFSPCEVMAGEGMNDEGEKEKCIVSAGCYLLVASGCGDTVQEAKDKAYEAVDSLMIPNSTQYRTDIGDRCKKDIKTLQEQGFCRDWKW